MSNYQKKYDIFIQNATATLHNDYLLLQKPHQLRFYRVRQIEKYISYTQSNQDDLMVFEMKAQA